MKWRRREERVHDHDHRCLASADVHDIIELRRFDEEKRVRGSSKEWEICEETLVSAQLHLISWRDY
jgi:hypothetical protein